MCADSFDRIEIPKIHDVSARLAVNPHNGRLGREPRGDRAQPHGLGMQRRARRDRAEREQHQRRSAAADIGIALERTRDDRRRQGAAATVTDNDDLVGRVGADGGDEALGAGVDQRIEA